MSDQHLSREDVAKFLRSKNEATVEYLDRIRGQERYGATAVAIWAIYAHIGRDDQVASYFTPELIVESDKLLHEWENLVTRVEKEIYHQDVDISMWQFPWFDNLDLAGNVTKQLTPEQMREYGAKLDKLPGDMLGNFREHAFYAVDGDPETRDLIEKKVDLDRRLMQHLETPKPTSN